MCQELLCERFCVFCLQSSFPGRQKKYCNLMVSAQCPVVCGWLENTRLEEAKVIFA